MTDFFTEFDAERWHFTYVDENDDSIPVQQVGVVAVFHIFYAYQSLRRKGISDAFALYQQTYCDKLKGGYRGDKRMIVRPFSKMSFSAYQDYIVNTSPMNAVEFKCMSTLSLGYASNYGFGAFSPAGWFEKIHGTFTTVRFYLPVEELAHEGRKRFEAFLLKCCRLLRPAHGAAGLGILQCHNWEDYQPIEYETAWSYRGVDVCGPTGNEEWRKGYSNLNWYTFLSHPWIASLGPPRRTADQAGRQPHRATPLRRWHGHPRR